MKKENVISFLPDERKLSEINFFGTHDSMTAFVDFEKKARCQSLSLREQLDLGVRLFDIRLSRKAGSFYLVHSLADCYTDKDKGSRMEFDFIFDECAKFLEENPRETLILSIKQDRGIQSKSFFPSFFQRYIKGKEEKWYLKNEIPSLLNCRGKIVLMRRCKVRRSFDKSRGGLDFSNWKDQSKRSFEPLPVILNEKEKAIVQDRYCLEAEEKWERCTRPCLENACTDESTIAVHFLSTSARKKSCGLDDTAETVNRLFKAFDLEKKKGWLLFDFPDGEIAQKIAESNF